MILLHAPTKNCSADCLTKTSVKADTAVQTGNLLDVDIHPDFRTLMEHKAFLSTWCKTFLHLKIFGPFQEMFVGTQQKKKQKK